MLTPRCLYSLPYKQSVWCPGSSVGADSLHVTHFPPSPQGDWTRGGQSYDHSERGHRFWTHAAAARGRDGKHSGPHGVPEPDCGAHSARVRERFRQVEAANRRRIRGDFLHPVFLCLSGAAVPQIFQCCTYRRVSIQKNSASVSAEWERDPTRRLPDDPCQSALELVFPASWTLTCGEKKNQCYGNRLTLDKLSPPHPKCWPSYVSILWLEWRRTDPPCVYMN